MKKIWKGEEDAERRRKWNTNAEKKGWEEREKSKKEMGSEDERKRK